MAKKKSKKHKKLAREQNGALEMGALGTKVKDVGTTVAGVLVGEIVEAAVEQLIKRFSSSNFDSENADQNTDHQHSNRIRSAIAKLQESAENAEQNGSGVANTIESAVGSIPPALTDVVDVLKNTTQRSLQQSAAAVGDTTQATIIDAVDAAKTVIDAVKSDSSAQSHQKRNKKGKKKKKG